MVHILSFFAQTVAAKKLLSNCCTGVQGAGRIADFLTRPAKKKGPDNDDDGGDDDNDGDGMEEEEERGDVNGSNL